MRILKIIFLIFIALGLLSCNQNKKPPVAKNGVLDLRNWDFEKDGNISLDGEWEFYWQGFLKSKEFDTVKTKHYIDVPSTWRGYDFSGIKIPYDGFATYRLKVLINPAIKDIGLKCSDEKTSFYLFINDSLFGKNGVIGTSRETSAPQYKPFNVYFRNTSDTINIIYQISNYQHWAGGFYYSCLIGSRDKIINFTTMKLVYDAIMFCSILTLTITLFLFYFFRSKERASLYVALFSFSYLFRILAIDEKWITHLIPDINWYLLYRMEWVFYVVTTQILLYYLIYLFKDFLSRKIIIGINVYYVFAIGILLLAPVYVSTIFHGYIQLSIIIVGSISIYILIKAIINHKEGSLIILLSFLMLVFGATNESLYYRHWTPLIIDSHLGIFLFCFFQMLLLSRRFSRAFNRIENFSHELKQEIADKTKDLRNEKEKSDNLLLNVLPEPIANRLKDGETQIADHFDEASIIFIDIAEFTKISSKSSPQIIVNELNKIFTIFDKISQKYGIEKIKTIGDCYMAAAGIPEPRHDHAEAVASMALEVMEVMQGYKTEEGFDIRFRIGLDCGPIVAGVIGEQKFIYDLWGDPVNTASRMEYFGVIGKIQCTSRFREKLEISHKSKVVSRKSEENNSDFQFIERGEIEVKGKGVMRTWFLEAKKASIMEEA